MFLRFQPAIGEGYVLASFDQTPEKCDKECWIVSSRNDEFWIKAIEFRPNVEINMNVDISKGEK
jgi:hypothetical protein